MIERRNWKLAFIATGSAIILLSPFVYHLWPKKSSLLSPSSATSKSFDTKSLSGTGTPVATLHLTEHKTKPRHFQFQHKNKPLDERREKGLKALRTSNLTREQASLVVVELFNATSSLITYLSIFNTQATVQELKEVAPEKFDVYAFDTLHIYVNDQEVENEALLGDLDTNYRDEDGNLYMACTVEPGFANGHLGAWKSTYSLNERKALVKTANELENNEFLQVVLEMALDSHPVPDFTRPLCLSVPLEYTLKHLDEFLKERKVYPPGMDVDYFVNGQLIQDRSQTLDELSGKYQDEDGALYLSFSLIGKVEVTHEH